jgi:hypothetical protein
MHLNRLWIKEKIDVNGGVQPQQTMQTLAFLFQQNIY